MAKALLQKSMKVPGVKPSVLKRKAIGKKVLGRAKQKAVCFRPDATVRRTETKSAVDYLARRCDLCNGRTVEECLNLDYQRSNGVMAKYTMADLRYDVKAKRLEVVGGTAGQSKWVVSKPSAPNRAGKMDVGQFFAMAQCSLKMEARELMGKDVALIDPEAVKAWPAFERMAKRNLGSNEKWVPYHTVLGVHEMFLVEAVHDGGAPWWTPLQRFIAMFIFRAHCKRELFTEVQLPFLLQKSFWKDLQAGFRPGSPMENKITSFRKDGNALQTSCFLIIPERILADDDANIVRNLLLRTQRLVQLAEDLWPVVNDTRTSPSAKFETIKQKILGVRNLGDTWVKMLMVVIDIAMPDLKLLQDRCEVGIGASDPMRKILEDEGLLSPKETRSFVGERRENVHRVQHYPDAKAGVFAVKLNNVQLIQVTMGMAGSRDRAHCIAEHLVALGQKQVAKPFKTLQEVLQKRRAQLFADKSLKVPELGLDAKADELLKGNGVTVKKDGPSPSEALLQLRDRINNSKMSSAEHFWQVLKKVEAFGRTCYSKHPLVVRQMRTQKCRMSAVTLQVQLCEFRQFQEFSLAGRCSLKRPAAETFT